MMAYLQLTPLLISRCCFIVQSIFSFSESIIFKKCYDKSNHFTCLK